MARGENPGQVISVRTTLTYNQNTPYGNANAGKDLCLDFNGGLVADDGIILGKFLDLDKSQDASVDIGGHNGEPLIFRKTADTINRGDLLIGAGSGKVKSASATTLAEVVNARFRCLRVLETGDNGRILAIRA